MHVNKTAGLQPSISIHNIAEFSGQQNSFVTGLHHVINSGNALQRHNHNEREQKFNSYVLSTMEEQRANIFPGGSNVLSNEIYSVKGREISRHNQGVDELTTSVILNKNDSCAISMPQESKSCIIDIPEKDNKTTVINMLDGNNNIDTTTEAGKRAFLRHINNLGAVLTRNLISVIGPTAAREYMRRGALPLILDNTSKMANILGGITGILPVALQLIGIARDIHCGTQTAESLRARLAHITLVSGAGAALVATGGLSAAANALISAVFVYAPLRDLSEYFLQLKDNNKSEATFSSSCKSATAYAGNQAIVDQGMEMLSNALEPLMGKLAANILGRVLMNMPGETVDELIRRGINALSENNSEVKFTLQFRPKDQITCKTALDQLFNTYSSRAALFSAAFANAYAIPVQGIINSMVVGATLGAAYVPFIYCHAQKKRE